MDLLNIKCTFPFSRVLLDWLVINDQKLPNWVWPTLYIVIAEEPQILRRTEDFLFVVVSSAAAGVLEWRCRDVQLNITSVQCWRLETLELCLHCCTRQFWWSASVIKHRTPLHAEFSTLIQQQNTAWLDGWLNVRVNSSVAKWIIVLMGALWNCEWVDKSNWGSKLVSKFDGEWMD
jgi:hypothetical protein